MGKSDAIVLHFDLQDRGVKARSLLAEIFKQKIASMPLCTVGVGIANKVDIFGGTCLPRGSNRTTLAGLVDTAVIKMLPDSIITSYTTVTLSPDTLANIDPIRRIFHFALYVLIGLLLLCLLLLLTLFYLVPGARIRWFVLSVLLGVSGLLVAGGSLIGKSLFNTLFQTYIIDHIPPNSGIPIETFSVLKTAFYVAFSDAINLSLVLSVILLSVGIFAAVKGKKRL